MSMGNLTDGEAEGEKYSDWFIVSCREHTQRAARTEAITRQ